MKNFIINLYANKYFPIYLGIVIIVLLIAFFIVFFLGKKDQKKIEETQKLDLEKLKEAQNSSTIVNNEVKNVTESAPVEVKTENVAAPEIKPIVEPIQTSITEDKPIVNEPITKTEETPKVMETKENINDVFVQTPVEKPINAPVEEINTPQITVSPKTPEVVNIPAPTPVVKPVIDDDTYRVNRKEEETVNRLRELSSSLDKEMKTFETKPAFEQPVINEKSKTMNVFSSVYVPNNKEVSTIEEKPVVASNNDFDETMEIELPKLKK